MKQLKPGQLCTIKGHVYRAKKRTTESICDDCHEANGTENCIFGRKPTFAPQLKCFDIFGLDNHPVLVK